jgi:hypothetical protein
MWTLVSWPSGYGKSQVQQAIVGIVNTVHEWALFAMVEHAKETAEVPHAAEESPTSSRRSGTKERPMTPEERVADASEMINPCPYARFAFPTNITFDLMPVLNVSYAHLNHAECCMHSSSFTGTIDVIKKMESEGMHGAIFDIRDEAAAIVTGVYWYG